MTYCQQAIIKLAKKEFAHLTVPLSTKYCSCRVEQTIFMANIITYTKNNFHIAIVYSITKNAEIQMYVVFV